MADYAALAKQYGGTTDTQGSVDYAALAQKFGGKQVEQITPEPEVLQRAPAETQPIENAPRDRTWGETAGQAALSFIPSVGRMVGGIAHTVMHPIDTAENVGKLVVGAGERGMENLVGQFNPELVAFNRQINKPSESEQIASNVGQFYGNRYGSGRGFKEALATDPAGVLADAATVLSGGGAAVTKAGLLPAGATLQKTAALVDPLSLAFKAAKGTGKVGGWLTEKGASLMTNTGDAMGELYKAGAKSKEATVSALENLRNKVPKTDVLLDLQDNIAQMKRNRLREYQQNMATTTANTKPLSYDDIDSAIAEAERSVTNTKGFVKNQKAVDLINDIKETVADAKAKGMNTAAEFDDLKQAINAVNEKYGFDNPSATRLGHQIYGAAKNTIVKQSPDYAKAMKSYEESSDILDEIKRTLSQNPNASIDTQMRKLQSLMRNDVSTNYGNRLDLVKQIEEQGGKEILPALAGQAANTWLPRGMGKVVTGGTAAGGLMTLNPMAIPMLGLSSPRIMGEAAVKAGQANRAIRETPQKVISLAKNNKLAEIAKSSKIGQSEKLNQLLEFAKNNKLSKTETVNLLYQLNQPKE